MQTIRWQVDGGDFTISNSAGRRMISIEPADAPDGDWYPIWAEWGWTLPQLSLGEPLEWEDEHDMTGEVMFVGRGLLRRREGMVRVRIHPTDESDLEGWVPTVKLTREQWAQAVDVLMWDSERWAEIPED